MTLQITPWLYLRLWSTKKCEYYYHEAQKSFYSQSWRPQSKILTEFDEMEHETQINYINYKLMTLVSILIRSSDYFL